MQILKIYLVTSILLLFISCKNNEGINNTADLKKNKKETLSSSAAVEKLNDTTHKFIRTADIKFKVQDVINSTYDIETVTTKHGGFVTNTNLASNISNVSTAAVSKDSSVETTNYIVTNTITLRIPNTKLDTTLKEIARNIDFLDFRIIKAEDVALSILANNLAEKRALKNEERLTNAIDIKGKKLNEIAPAEDAVVSKKEQADNAKISNLSLNDQINFSTVNLAIYQRQTIISEVIANDKIIDAYEPSFGSKLLESLSYGWDILKNFVLFIVKFWGLFLAFVGLYFLNKKYGYKLKSSIAKKNQINTNNQPTN